VSAGSKKPASPGERKKPTLAVALDLDEAAVEDIETTEEKLSELPWEEVKSSYLRRIAWCETEKLESHLGASVYLKLGWLWVEFQEGRIYGYEQVPWATYEALRIASSPGGAFHKLIKGRYRYVAWAERKAWVEP
jgi:hypothetical protein